MLPSHFRKQREGRRSSARVASLNMRMKRCWLDCCERQGRAWRNVVLAVAAAATVASLYVVGVLTGVLEPSVNGKVMVLYARSALPFSPAPAGQGSKGGLQRWAGMFSEVTSVLGALRFAEHHKAAAVRVNFLSPSYADEEGDNWWAYHFEPEMVIAPEDTRAGSNRGASASVSMAADAVSSTGLAVNAASRLAAVPQVHFNKWIARFGRFGGFGHLIYGGDDTRPWYPVKGAVSRAEGHHLFSSYIRVREHIQRQVDEFARAHLDACPFLLSLHYRGTDTRFHYPYKAIAYEQMLVETRRILEHYKVPPSSASAAATNAPARLPFCIYVATDEQDFLDWLRARPGVGAAVTFFPRSPRVAATSNAIHFTDDASVTKRTKGETAVIDCLLLARARHLIKTRSSISDISTIVNPHMNFTYVLGDKEIYDVWGETQVLNPPPI